MPHILVKTSSGPVNFYYNILTPTDCSASHIDTSLPTLIFLHPIWVSQHIFHPQFCDPILRRFNIVAVDARLHGRTTGIVPSNYRCADAADDLFYFMEALSLPPCHLIGLCMGSSIALQLAIAYPEVVLTLTMLSPLSLEEPADVVEGRREIYQCWVESQPARDSLDESALLDSVWGGLQFGFNNDQSKLVNAVAQLTVPDALRNWTHDTLDQLETMTVKFNCDRKPHSVAVLRRVKAPVALIHFSEDVAFPVTYAQKLLERLQDAGLDARLFRINGAPRFGSVTKASEIDPIIHDFVAEHSSLPLPPIPLDVVSPFESGFAEHGCPRSGEIDSDDSDDDLIFL